VFLTLGVFNTQFLKLPNYLYSVLPRILLTENTFKSAEKRSFSAVRMGGRAGLLKVMALILNKDIDKC